MDRARGGGGAASRRVPRLQLRHGRALQRYSNLSALIWRLCGRFAVEESRGSGHGQAVSGDADGGERDGLDRPVSRGKADARKLTHARVLLQADASEAGPGWSDAAVSEALRVGVRAIGRVRQRFVEDGLAAAWLRRASPRVHARKLDGMEARLIALACSDPPAGRKRWTLRLLAERMSGPGRRAVGLALTDYQPLR